MLILFVILPLAAALVLQYGTCRLTMGLSGRRRGRAALVRLLPLLLAVAVIAAVAVGRWQIWRSERVSPVTQLIFFPGVPGFFFLLVLLLGWRLWKKWWAPRVIDDPGP